MKSYTKIKERLLKDKAARKAYQKLSAEFVLVENIIEKRLAKALDTKPIIFLS